MEQTTPSISMTSGQKRDLRKLVAEALDEARLSKDSAQKVKGRGGELKAGVKELLTKLSASDLLEPCGTVSTPAIPTFSAKDHFKVNTSGEVKIGYIWEGFSNAFLAGGGKVEVNIAETTLCVHKLRKASVDGPIIAELGGDQVAETSLAQMYELMKAQGRGQQGTLLTNGYANIFYVRDAKGVLWAVYCRWYSAYGDWDVGAHPILGSDAWRVGCRVFSR